MSENRHLAPHLVNKLVRPLNDGMRLQQTIDKDI
ncbi:hypothetical protein Bhyg_08708 [Pseudolycoriella hygida]|uniref:Uncharacterized protein n=1 Tax=Pseudolycoriella hygida TaxID=35572 RepID=A0A9Q0N544_9DIPT|nr:hypothetical protein Bhyg_08708 [Pseudolycoriella hygida]